MAMSFDTTSHSKRVDRNLLVFATLVANPTRHAEPDPS